MSVSLPNLILKCYYLSQLFFIIGLGIIKECIKLKSHEKEEGEEEEKEERLILNQVLTKN